MRCFPVMLLLFSAFLVENAFSQEEEYIRIENKTSCTYLVKANVLPARGCKPSGVGPLLLIQPNSKLTLPPVPEGHWVMGYGVEEFPQTVDLPTIARVDGCPGMPPIEKPMGTCKATFEASSTHLIIQTQKMRGEAD